MAKLPMHGGWTRRVLSAPSRLVPSTPQPLLLPADSLARALAPVLTRTDLPRPLLDAVTTLAADLVDLETQTAADPEQHPRRRVLSATHDPAAQLRTWVDALVRFITRVAGQTPKTSPTSTPFTAPLVDLLPHPSAVIDDLIATLLPFADPELPPPRVVAHILKNNILDRSGLRPEDADRNPRRLKWPSATPLSGSALVAAYLADTPFVEFFATPLPFALANRSSHHHIVATPGAGKSNALSTMIAKDLDAVATGKASVLLLESQNDLIASIVRHPDFAPAGRLHNRLVFVDATDVDYPVQLNFFARSASAPREKRAQFTALFDLLSFLFSASKQETTGRQETLLRAVSALIQEIPNATISTLNDIFAPADRKAPQLPPHIAPYLAKLDPSLQQFFATDFQNQATFGQSREQVRARLQALITDDIFRNMFSAPTQKLDLAAEMNAGKVILINADRDLLGSGTEIFGRFFIALIAQAAQARSQIPRHKRLPTHVYIDEAADYVKTDTNVEKILDTARKYEVGIVLSHQRLSQFTSALQSAASMAAIKMVRAPVNEDKRTLAAQLHTTPEFLDALPRHAFATYQRGQATAIAVTVPLSPFENGPRMSDAQFAEVRRVMRAKYARPLVAPPTAHPSPLPPTRPPSQPPPVPSPPLKPSPAPRTIRAGRREHVYLPDYVGARLDALLDPRTPTTTIRVNALAVVRKANRPFAHVTIEPLANQTHPIAGSRRDTAL